MVSYLHPLGASCQEVQDPDAGVLRHTQVPQFAYQSARNDGVEGRAEVQEEQPRVAPSLFHMSQRGVEGGSDGVLCGPVGSVSKLVGVQGRCEALHNLTLYQFFEALHDDGGKCYWPVVI